jgi:hypothetical protein
MFGIIPIFVHVKGDVVIVGPPGEKLPMNIYRTDATPFEWGWYLSMPSPQGKFPWIPLNRFRGSGDFCYPVLRQKGFVVTCQGMAMFKKNAL